MVYYTIQVTNHKGAAARIVTQEAGDSWITVYDGPIATGAEARACVDRLSAWYRSARVFRGKNLGKLYYAVLRNA